MFGLYYQDLPGPPNLEADVAVWIPRKLDRRVRDFLLPRQIDRGFVSFISEVSIDLKVSAEALHYLEA